MTDKTITVTLKLNLDDLAAQFRAAADALTADQYAANEERQREEELEDAWQSRDWETVERLQDEAEQRRAGLAPDPLDENDHRDRVMADGGRRLVRSFRGHWHTPQVDCHRICTSRPDPRPSFTLALWDEDHGPLTFAPDAAPDAPRADLTAPEAERAPEDAEVIVERWEGK